MADVRLGLLWLLLAISFIASIAGLAPASFLISRISPSAPQVGYGAVFGTLWRGGISDVSYGNVPIGDLNFATSPLQFSPVGPRVSWRSRNGAVTGEGTIGAGLFGADRFTTESIDVDLALLPLRVPIQGMLRLAALSITADRTGCQAAEGQARLAGQFNAGSIEAPVALSGGISCEDGFLLFRLSGPANGSPVDVEVVLAGLSTVSTRIKVAPANDMERIALMSYGFVRSGSQYELVETVRLR